MRGQCKEDRWCEVRGHSDVDGAGAPSVCWCILTVREQHWDEREVLLRNQFLW